MEISTAGINYIIFMAISLICENIKKSKVLATQKETQDNYVNGKVLNLFEQAQT
jgi:threonine/homoserine/homoserine lactone efflux protein